MLEQLPILDGEIIEEGQGFGLQAPHKRVRVKDGPPLKFCHLRYHFTHPDFGIVTESNPDGIWEKGGITIATQRYPTRLLFAFAICCRSDHYSRALGRKIAQGRIEARRHYHELPIVEGANVGQIYTNHIKPRAYQQANLENLWQKDFEEEIGNGVVSVNLSHHLY